MSNNPLLNFYRTPKIYIKLPSQNVFYNKEDIETSVNGEIGILPLTSIDQILLKTPDAMLNGEALVTVFQNCIPGIKSVKKLVQPDINALIIAIRIASNGQMMEINTACPNCKKEHTFDINLQYFLDSMQMLNDEPVMELDNKLILRIKPYDFNQRNLQILNEIEEAQTIRMLETAESTMSDADKVNQMGKQVQKMAERTFDIVSQSITSIFIKETNETVTDAAFISEFLKSIPGKQADAIINKIKELNELGVNPKTSFLCDSCNHEWDQTIDFDPTSFFD